MNLDSRVFKKSLGGLINGILPRVPEALEQVGYEPLSMVATKLPKANPNESRFCLALNIKLFLHCCRVAARSYPVGEVKACPQRIQVLSFGSFHPFFAYCRDATNGKLWDLNTEPVLAILTFQGKAQPEMLYPLHTRGLQK